MVLNVLYVCLLHSRFVENHPIWILKDGPLISEVILSHWVLQFKVVDLLNVLYMHQTRTPK
jgi:hypothetical protein